MSIKSDLNRITEIRKKRLADQEALREEERALWARIPMLDLGNIDWTFAGPSVFGKEDREPILLLGIAGNAGIEVQISDARRMASWILEHTGGM